MEVFRGLSLGTPAITHRLEGKQATVLLVGGEPGSAAQYAVKVFPQRQTSREAIRYEVAALERFRAALEARDDLACPSPVASSDELCVYVMTLEEGRRMEQALIERPASAWREVAERIVAGLDLYYRSVGDVYGDFQPRNLLLGPRDKVIFLDPGIPNVENPTYSRLAAELEYSPGSVDLGYWLHVVVSRFFRLLVTRPRVAFGRWRFTVELLARTAQTMAPRGEARSFLLEVRRAGRQHLAWLRTNSGSRGMLVSVLGTGGAGWLVRRALRRLS
jgi:hypothetical protein